MTFDKPSEESLFLRFVAAEFRRRGTKLRRRLSNKMTVHRLLEEKTIGGVQVGLPRQYDVLTSVDQLTAEVLGDRVALKFAHGWSAKGVMLLERAGEDRYFDNLSLRELSLATIRERQQAIAASFSRKQPSWIVEDLLSGPQPGPVPFDYKFYMFQGQIGLVLQIDRNSSPPRIAFLGEDLKPLTEDRDYRLTTENSQPGVPLVPRSAVMLSRWAIELSQMTDAPFVRVDLYDTDQGPVFGEFTFSPGAEYKRAVMFSHDMLERFDHLFRDAKKRLKGEATQSPDSWSTLLQQSDPQVLTGHPVLGLTEYRRFASYLYNQGALGGYRLAEAQRELAEHGAEETINGYLARAHSAVGDWVKSRHKLSAAVRREAVRQVVEDGRPAEEVAEEIHFPLYRLIKLVEDASKDPSDDVAHHGS